MIKLMLITQFIVINKLLGGNFFFQVHDYVTLYSYFFVFVLAGTLNFNL